MYNCGEKFVDFEHWCPLCKHEKDLVDKEGNTYTDPYCDECLEVAARLGTSKPMKWEEK